jgi:hypothetical protein
LRCELTVGGDLAGGDRLGNVMKFFARNEWLVERNPRATRRI